MQFLPFLRQGVDSCGLRFCFVVCGLHRSGTSAVARLVNLLGADISSDLCPSSPENPRGYWESDAVVRIHDRLLKALDAWHDGPFDPMPLRSDWLVTDAARKAKRRLTSAIKQDFADSRLFVVKDPRISRLLPLWVELLADIGIAPIIVIPFRNPLEVAASLALRDHIALPKALLLYLHAHLDIEVASRALPRVFVGYDQLLKDWRPFARRLSQISDAQLSSPSARAVSEIDDFLTIDLYHHRFSREQILQHPEVPVGIADMFNAMNEADDGGDESKLYGVFDRLRANIDGTGQLYCRFVTSELQDSWQQLMRTREAFESSTSWRATAPLRWLKLRVLSKMATRHRHPSSP
jgi:hypothetical protein